MPQRQDAVAERLSDILPGRFRLRRGPARRAGRRQRRRVYVRRRGSTPRHGSRERRRSGAWTHKRRVQRAEGLFRRGRFAARRRRQGHREHRWRRRRASWRSSAKTGSVALDRHRGCRELFVGDRRDDRRAAPRGVPDPQRAGGSRSRERRGAGSSVPWRARQDASVNAATPLVIDNLIFVSAEYGPGAARPAARRTDPDDALVVGRCVVESLRDERVFRRRALRVPRPAGAGPSLRAVDFKSGQVKWSEEKFGAGTVTLAGDQLVVMRENGELLLAPVTPSGFKPTARARDPSGDRSRLSCPRRRVSLRPQRRHARLPGSAADP